MDFAASAVERDSLAEVQTRPEFHNLSNPRAWATVSVVVRFKHWRNYAQPSDWGTQYLAAFSRNGLVRPKPPDGSTRTTHECSNWHLQQAKEELQRAAPNKGGHREKAMELVNQAIQQIQEGEQYDEQHPGR
jgi:hypothetical protein